MARVLENKAEGRGTSNFCCLWHMNIFIQDIMYEELTLGLANSHTLIMKVNFSSWSWTSILEPSLCHESAYAKVGKQSLWQKNMKASSCKHILSCSSIHDNPWLQREKHCSRKKYETCLVSMPGINLSLSRAFKGTNITDKSQDFSWIKLVSGKIQIKHSFRCIANQKYFPPPEDIKIPCMGILRCFRSHGKWTVELKHSWWLNEKWKLLCFSQSVSRHAI